MRNENQDTGTGKDVRNENQDNMHYKPAHAAELADQGLEHLCGQNAMKITLTQFNKDNP